MINKPYTPYTPYKQPYIPSNRFDDRPMSKQIYKVDNSNLNADMASTILSANPSEILNFFIQNPYQLFIDTNGNSPVHLIIVLDENKLGQQQKIDLIKELIIPPFNLSIDSTNNKSETPLHIAIKKQFNLLVEFLISNGANPNKINFLHQNSLHIAMIPNINPCEKEITPEPIIELESNLEDKDNIYNEILSVFYNNIDEFYKKPVTPPTALDNLDNFNIYTTNIFTAYYDNLIKSKWSLNSDNSGNPTIVYDTSKLDIILKDIVNKIHENTTNTKITDIIIEKNISYHITNGLNKMIKLYEEFIPKSLNEINLEEIYDFNDVSNLQNIIDKINKYKDPNDLSNKNMLSSADYLAKIKKSTENTLKKELQIIHGILTIDDYKTISTNFKNIEDKINILLTTTDKKIQKQIIYEIFALFDLMIDNFFDKIDNTIIFYQNNILHFNDWFDKDIVPTQRIIDLLNILILFKDKQNYKLFIDNNITLITINTPYSDLFNEIIDKEPPITIDHINSYINVIGKQLELEYNPILPNHIKNLNLWIAYNNMQEFNKDDLYSNLDAVVPVPATIPNPLSIDINPNTNTTDILSATYSVPNSYDKGFDFMDFLKKEYIYTIVNNIFTNKNSTTTPPPTPTKIYTEIQNIIKNKYLNEIVETEVILIIIKIIDKMIISIIKNNIYIGCVKKLKEKIIVSVPSIKSYDKIFDKIITQKNVTLKLDKIISDMINIKNSLSSSFDPKYLNEIVDDEIVSKIKSPSVNEPNEIHKKDNNQYLVFYNTDYNSIVPISIRQCMFNSIQIIKNLFSTKNKPDIFKPDIFKLDSNGFTPIYYGIKNKNYLLIRELVNSTDNFYIQYQLNKYTASPIKYAFDEFLKYSETPKWVNINDTFINNLLLSAQINQNIPTKYDKIYLDLIKFLNKNVIKFEFNTIEIDISNESVVKKWLFTDSIDRFDDFKIIIDTINSLIIGKKSISSEFEKLINLKKQLNFDGKINEIKKLIIMFEKKYGKKELTYTGTNLKNDNYFNIVVNMGIVAIRKIFNYYKFIIQKLILTSNAYNNKKIKIDKKKINDNLLNNMNEVIKTFFTNNGENLVRTFYFIKKDKFDRLDNTISVIDNYMTILLENLNQNGIVIPDSDIEKNIKQYINPHVGELLSKTLLYNQLLIDISHKYIINIYHSIKTLDELTKKK